MELRKKQFALLLHVVNELQDELEQEEKEEAAAAAAADEEVEDGEEEEEEGAVPAAMDTD